VVIDIESSAVLERDSFDYVGPIERCGGIFAGLTKPGIAAPGQPTQFFDNLGQAGHAEAADAAKTIQPSTSTMQTPLTINQDGSSAGGSATTGSAPTPVQPQMIIPTWQQAQASGGGELSAMNPMLSTKGKVLGTLLQAGLGAAVGDAAARQGSPRTGYPGASAGAMAGMQLPFQQRQQQMELENEQLAQQRQRAQIAALPGTLQQERDLRASEIAKNNAVSDRKEVFQAKDGSILERQSDGSLKSLYAAPDKPDAADTVQGRQEIISKMKAAAYGTPDLDASGNLTGRTAGVPYSLTPAQETAFLLTGKIPETKEGNPNQSELLLRAAQGDQTALKALQLQSDNEIRTHNGYNANSDLDGMSAGQQRAIKNDAQWSNINRRMGALTQQYARQAAFDPDGAKALSAQIDDLANQAEQRKAQILQGGKLSLKGSNQPTAIPMAVSHQPSAPAQQFSHLSASGKFGWNGTQWVPTGK
jgi:hypothetical protein